MALTPTITRGSNPIFALCTIDFASTAANTRSTGVDVTVTGARAGDIVNIRPRTVTGSQQFFAVVSANDTVTCYFDNYTAGTVDPASQEFFISVDKMNFAV